MVSYYLVVTSQSYKQCCHQVTLTAQIPLALTIYPYRLLLLAGSLYDIQFLYRADESFY